jgi:chromosome segregation ATPase
MKSEPVIPTEQVTLLRQQVILSQVRIMELEDTRDDLATRLAEMEKLLIGAQALSDQKIDEATHLANVNSELQTQFDDLRHTQHVTHVALEETRGKLAEASQSLAAQAQVQADLLARISQAQAQLGQSDQSLQQAREETARHSRRITQLDRERRAMQGSRSWRWTAWLRTIERALARRKS